MSEPAEPTLPAVEPDHLRLAEAVLFAAAEPVSPRALAELLPDGVDPRAVVAALSAALAGRGVEIAEVAGGWQMRTAADLAPLLRRRFEVPRRLSRAAVETLAVIAYHQPVTRAEIEEIRGVSLAPGTLDALTEAGFVEPKGRRDSPGRPTVWGTTKQFLAHFGLASLKDLPRLAELQAAGLLDPLPAAPAAGPAEAGAAAAAEGALPPLDPEGDRTP